MTYVFVSNFFNHHQKSFSEVMNTLTGNKFYFIETGAMSDERKKLGWAICSYPAYVKRLYESDESYRFCGEIIDNAEVVIAGSAPEDCIKNRLKNNKLTFRCSERIYKNGYQWYKLPKRLISFYLKSGRYKNLYMLCASAYTATDFAKTRTFIDKNYKWGYFPEAKRYDNIERLIQDKKSASILWVARIIEYKHPEVPLELARRLKQDGYSFNINIIGSGILEEQVKQMIEEYHIDDCVHILGSMSPENVRIHMENSCIFLFTSDRNEGWGAVLNESMNSGCAVVASHAIGSVPFMIKDKINGFIYKNGDMDDLYTKVKYLLDNHEERHALAIKAYETITEQWNAENAASRLIQLSQTILKGDKRPNLFNDGVCSKAYVLKDDWYDSNK